MYLWPYIEQTALSSKINLTTQHFYLAPATIGNTLNGLTGAKVPLYYCPSDNGSDLTVSYYQRRRGNYVVNWGVTRYGSNPGGVTAPFAHLNGNRSTSRITRLMQITDGTSNTLMMAEYLMATSPNDDDWRGDIQNDGGVFRFHTVTTPNTTAPDVVNWAQQNGDPLMPVSTSGSQFNTARSRHTGGVNVSFCDGSIQFISDTVTLAIWQALGTMNGNEVVGSFN